MLRQIELVSGLLAGLLGLIYPIMLLMIVAAEPGHWRPGGVAVLLLIPLALIGAAVGTYGHGRRGLIAGLVQIWACVVLLLAFSVLSTGRLFLLPALLTTLSAAVSGSLAQGQRTM